MNFLQRLLALVRPARLYMLHADFLHAFNLPGRLPVGANQRVRVDRWQHSVLDENFFSLEFFVDYEPVLQRFLAAGDDEDMSAFRRFSRKLPWLLDAFRAEHAGLHADAVTAWQTILRLDPLDAMARYHLGRQRILTGDYSGATGELQLALQEYPRFNAARFDLGYALMESGQLEEAKDAFHRLLELQPGDRDVLAALERLGEFIAVYDDPRQPETMTFLSREAWKRRIEEEMVRNWVADDVLSELGQRALREGFPTLARRCLERACCLREDPATLFAIGLACCEEGQLQDGMRHFQELLEKNPSNPALHLAMADARFKLERPDLALRHLRVTLAGGEAGRQTISLLDRVLCELEGVEASCQQMNQLVVEQPENPWPLHVLAEHFRKKEDYPGALRCLQEAIRREPDEESFYGEAAVLCGRLGKFEEVIQLLNGRLPGNELTPVRIWNLALAYRDLDRRQEAVELFQHFLSMDIPERFEELARRELDRLTGN